MSKYIRHGQCNRCGECCKQVGARFMISKDTGLCRFLREKPKGIFSCRITMDVFRKRVTEKPGGVTIKQFRYWQTECQPFPNPDDPGHLPPRYTLPEKCGYQMIEVK